MDKQQLKEREAKVIELAVAFCKEHLDDECAELCTKLVQKLGRKRSCPLQSGTQQVQIYNTFFSKTTLLPLKNINVLF